MYSSTFEQVIGSKLTGGNGKSCSEVICGANASCTMTTQGAQCICDEGYQGDGIQCALPSAMTVPTQVFSDGPFGESKRAKMIAMVPFDNNRRIAMVYQNLERKKKGYIVLGTIEGESVEWSAPERFSGKTEAYDPIVVAQGRSVAIAWRDAESDGRCWARTAIIGIPSDSRDHLTWSDPTNFCGSKRKYISQNFGATFVGEASDTGAARFMISFADTDKDTETKFGNAYLGDMSLHYETPDTILPKIKLTEVGKFRFSETEVKRLNVQRL